ncbi:MULTISPECIES: DUF7210 family protein [Ralstonia solanacearum species complex]|uniref:DUF7210 family protein n=1 Tax=Ralstonia solanacearum species complex TaxID=3116862 RepID=UPI0006BE16C1|nr:hypothetical protein [Ralstonia solanacearum]YP_009226547.1 hypothetical protein AXI85_gp43 [Ralstonia phage RS138]BEU73976.1 hypothetical protein MAFF211271_35310 [Ralstonia pseudosolanacearum]AXV78888.1 hypothetical protein CJO76_17975 [Ralstonia solanacearum]AXV92910.1 hypothetical protein CJO79_17960 [Ralstonia solanacearum]AXW20974.1 hypothetical protein CJO85_18005 [Ralstonia solanacearum]AXW77808.1 hypothetical protein CJO97_17955 [Ralstonia solanacearum]
MDIQSGTVAVELAQPHKHAGKPRNTGDTIHVSPLEAKWLQDNGIGKPPKTEDGSDTTPSARKR